MTAAAGPHETVSACGVTVRVPPGWHAGERGGAVLALCESAPHEAQPAMAVITSEPLESADAGVEWFRACRTELDRRCRHLEVVELAEVTVAGRRARRLVATHAVVGLGGAVLDQWLVPAEDRGVVLTCSVPALAYDRQAETFAGVAATMSIGACT